MADTVNTQTIMDGPRRVVMLFTNVSDGTGETAVVKMDPSIMVPICDSLKIMSIKYATSGMSVAIYFDGAVDRPVFVCSADDSRDHSFQEFGGLVPPSDLAASTGKILFTTTNHSSGDIYTILIDAVKRY